MLKPFQIRDQQGSPSSSPVQSSGPRGVRISASDYDDLASHHPRARLTYLDDDDGDQITVGTSLELAQRLDEPLEIGPMQFSQDEPEPMHLFDIRRSNSVTELWKRFESQSLQGPQIPETKSDVPASAREEPPLQLSSTAVPDSQPLLAAFEAELANILGSSEDPAERAPQAEPSPRTESSTNANPQTMPHIAEAIAAQILHHLANGANLVQSELRTRLPDLQRQVRDAQIHLPENIGSSLQALLTTLEAHMRTAFNNLPDNGRQWADNGRYWAEEAIHAGRPVAENAAESVRMMASEFNEVGRTLFAAFEHEFGRPAPQGTNAPHDGSNTASAAFANGSSNVPAASANPPAESRPADSNPEAKASKGDDHTPAAEPATRSHATAPVNSYSQAAPRFSPRFGAPIVSSFPYHVPQPAVCPPAYPPPYPMPPSYQIPYSSPGGYHAHPTPSSNSVSAEVRPPYPNPYRPGSPPWVKRLPTYSTHRHGPLPVPSRDISLSAVDKQTEEPEKKTLFIGNVGFNVTERTIQDVFASKGYIVTVDLPLDAVSGKHAGFGYLHFPSIHPAVSAMGSLQGTHIDGHAINLEFSDFVPIQDVSSQGVTNSTDQHQPLKSGPKTPDTSGVEQNQDTPIKRRRSVTFQVSDQSTKDTAPQSSDAVKAVTPSAKEASSPLIDFSIDESASESRTRHDVPVNLNSELEMSRFPPVSQLEAHHLATQRQRGLASNSQAVKHSDSTPAFTADLPRRSRTIAHPQGQGNRSDAGPGLRRASTITSTTGQENSNAVDVRALDEVTGWPSMRRRASERQALNTVARPARGLDTWARLDRRERERSRSSQHNIPGSFPAEVPQSSSLEVRDMEDAIENCVSSLIKMGYGSAEDGGRARMVIYAAASNGSLLDAIEMIEDERKAYARHAQK
ncbi:hypothetical protein N7490_011286 [Penicillium lividum]|nr:hypothetical protein N7490_011286 [Penicillium lividum]